MHRWTVPFFALFLLTPAIAGMLGFGTEAIENRTPAPFPSWTRQSWLDREQYTRLGDWLTDALPLRAQAVTLDSWIDYEVLGDSPSSQVLLGRDGELFLERPLSSPCPSPQLDRVVGNARLIAHALRRGGADSYLLFSPDKAFLHADRLPRAAAAWEDCHARARDELRQSLREQQEFVSVDLWTEFEREYSKGRQLFAKLNRHWNADAGIVQARTLVKSIQRGVWDPSAVHGDGTDQLPAELPVRFMNLVILQEEDVYRFERPGIETQISRGSIAANARWQITQAKTRSSGPPLIPGRTIVVHDSFMFRSAPFLNGYFEHIQYLHWEGVGSHPAEAAKLMHGADRIVFQLIEDDRARNLGGKRLPLLSSLANAVC